jgi:hypothetical protein
LLERKKVRRRPKGLGTTNSPKPDDPDCEFVKACRELGFDEDPAAFDQVLKKITKAPPLLRT